MKDNRKSRGKGGLLYGVALNDADYTVCPVVNGKQEKCPIYSRWQNVLERCYSESFRRRCPTYTDCILCEGWHKFSNFKFWMETQDWEGKELDKDLLIKGNKIYSPETCVFVDQKVNKFLIDCARSRGDYPIGVCFDKYKGKFKSSCQCVVTGKNKNLGYYRTPEEAHEAWLTFKIKQAQILADGQTDPRIKEAIRSWYLDYKQ